MVAHRSNLSTLAGILSERISPTNVEPDGWPPLIELAIQQDLGPMLLWIVQRAGLFSERDQVWKPLVLSKCQALVHYMLLLNAQRRTQAALLAKEIPLLWLKGIALAQTIYPDPSLRPMLDIDLLVPYEHRLSARAEIFALGFHDREVYSFDQVPDLIHHFTYHYSLAGGPHDAVVVELHFHLLDRLKKGSPLSPEHIPWFWEQRHTVSEGDMTFTTLSPEAHLLYLCAHAILQHGERDFRLLRFLDLHLLLTHCSNMSEESSPGEKDIADAELPARVVPGATLDWHIVVDQASSLGWTIGVERALALTVEYFGTPIPDWVFIELRARRSPDEDLYCVIDRRAGINQLSALQCQLSEMGTLGKVRSLYAIALPSVAHLRSRYSIQPTQQAWPYYFRLWLDQGHEVMRWIRKRQAENQNAG